MEVQPLAEQVGLPPCTEVLGAPVHILDVENVLRLMEQWIRQRDRSHWIAAHRDRLKSPVIIAIGAAIKSHSGKVVPSPRWASKAGLEWLWRLLHEPRTVWRRALVYGPQFMALSLLDLMRHKGKKGD
jgi:hypothetical protein